MDSWSRVRQSIYNRLSRTLDVDNEYVAVVTGTDNYATPHLHAVIYVDDPDDEIGPDDFDRALRRHVDECPGAFPEHHRYADDGSDGAVIVEHHPTTVDPLQTEKPPDTYATAASKYVATQLPHLPIAQWSSETEDSGWCDGVTHADLETGAWSWASPFDNYLHSKGFQT
jgi:hypothetical protein